MPSLAELAAKARKGEKVRGGTEVASAEETVDFGSTNTSAQGVTTVGRKKLSDPTKPADDGNLSVLAKLAEEKRKKQEAEATRLRAGSLGRLGGEK